METLRIKFRRIVWTLSSRNNIKRKRKGEKILNTIYNERITDIVVCGGGLAGSAAAIAAARQGKSVILIEENGILGGAATLGLVTPLDSRESRTGKPFGGLLEEIVQKTEELSCKYCKTGYIEEGTADRCAPHILKYVLLKLATDAKVEVFFHTRVIGVEKYENKIVGVFAQTRDGVIRIQAQVFVDGTGDGVLIEKSGASFVLGSEKNTLEQLSAIGLDVQHEGKRKIDNAYEEKPVMQPVSIFFVMGGVDIEKARKYCGKTLQFKDLNITKTQFENWEYANTLGFEVQDEKLPLPQGRILLTETPRKGVYAVNMSRVIGIDGSKADSLNEGEIKAQLQLIAIVDFLKTFVPGFEHAYLQESGSTLGVRETRRLKGKYTLTGTDIYYSKRFKDAVARGFYLIDIHNPHGNGGAIGGSIQGDFYEIPYGCLVDEKIDNLLACGRCISADHIAHSATRIQGTCIATGEAAGVAAALSLKKGIEPNRLLGKDVAVILKTQRVFLD